MPSKVFSGAIVGLDAKLVEVEIDASHGLRFFNIVGLPDKTHRRTSCRDKTFRIFLKTKLLPLR